jgi:hypothetical protein
MQACPTKLVMSFHVWTIERLYFIFLFVVPIAHASLEAAFVPEESDEHRQPGTSLAFSPNGATRL